MKTRTLPKTEDKVGSSVLGTKEVCPSHLVFGPKSMATIVTSNHRHYWAGHSFRQYVVWVGYLSPNSAPMSPKGSLIHRIPKRDASEGGIPSFIVLCCLIFSSTFNGVVPDSVSVEGFPSLMTLVSVYNLGKLIHNFLTQDLA